MQDAPLPGKGSGGLALQRGGTFLPPQDALCPPGGPFTHSHCFAFPPLLPAGALFPGTGIWLPAQQENIPFHTCPPPARGPRPASGLSREAPWKNETPRPITAEERINTPAPWISEMAAPPHLHPSSLGWLQSQPPHLHKMPPASPSCPHLPQGTRLGEVGSKGPARHSNGHL